MKRPSWIRPPLLGLAFAAGWLGCALAMQRVLPRPHVPVLDEKRSRFLADAAGTDTVFIGSSRVYHQFIPRQFDEAMRAAGRPTRSFNFGVDGLVPPESFFAVEDLLRLRPRLRWVFIELQPVQPRFPQHYAGTIRAWWWHDWRHTLLVVRASLRDPQWAGAERFTMLRMHAGLLLRYSTRPGRGAEWVSEKLRARLANKPRPAPHLRSHAREWLGEDGFVPMPGAPLAGAGADDYRTRLEAYRRAPAIDLPPEVRTRLRELVAVVRGIGATPVFIITPSVNPWEKIGDLRAQGVDAELLAFNDAGAFPSLYDPAMLVNKSHLNEAGAREFTRLLAARFAALHQPPPP